MPNSLVFECTDCLEDFCGHCDDYTRCPDCLGRLCETCSADASQARMSRCSSCHDSDLASIAFPYDDDTRKLHKHYSSPVKGKLD